MKTFAAALLMVTAEAGLLRGVTSHSGAPDGAVIVGGPTTVSCPDGSTRSCASGTQFCFDDSPVVCGASDVNGVIGGGLGPVIVGPGAVNPTVGALSTVLIDSGVDNNPVDRARFEAAVQGSNLLRGNVAGYLAGVRLASQLPLSASAIGTFGDRVPVATSTYVDVVEERPFTVDASTTKTITDVKKRQEPEYFTETFTDTVYTPGTVTKQRDLLVTDVEARPQVVSSTQYATFGTSGSQ